MLALIIGSSGSGKSAFAENMVMEFGEYSRAYIATMEIFDEESRRRVDRHRKMRAYKDFRTIESPTHLEDVVINSKEVVLLECMSNLVANEIFSPNGRKENVVDIICDGVKKINSLAEHMVIVTNDVFADGANYDESTNDYIAKLGEINCRLGAIADEVYEVAAGIPVRYK